MTNEDKKLIFEYCGWAPKYKQKLGYAGEEDWECTILNGNDMLEAVRIMESKGDMFSFHQFSHNRWLDIIDVKKEWIPYILQNFFPLMAEWLKERGE